MNAQLAPEAATRRPGSEGAQALLRCVVITDLCNSTALVERLGDQAAADLLRAHDRMLRRLIHIHRGQEIDKTDGFLSLFERPIQAVAFALDYQRGLNEFGVEHGIELKSRVGIHVGEVMSWHNEADDIAKGAKPFEIEGLAKPVAARLMGLALPGQILLSGVAYTLAHRAEGELGATLSRLKWMHHGRFQFKGVAESVPVYEIGEPGIAPFKSPSWSGKAHREVPLWRRPAMVVVEALLIAAAVALPAWHFLKPEPAIAFAERDWVVLGDLRNLTGDSRFDDSLEQAFRIGLEQSRHVNVLSDLQVRDTLLRMQRGSDTHVDRSIGAEVALREGARALVLPTLAEVGGRLRFTAEIVDPSTQATVFSDFADGHNVDAVLPVVDDVNRKLRERLGEAIAQVETNSQPLEKVATADLDALRAYTRAIGMLDARQTDDGRALLTRAIQIDPEFARAHLELGVSCASSGERDIAIAHLKNAIKFETRLAERERNYASALLHSQQHGGESALNQWRTLHLTYPDYFPGSGAYAWFLWISANNYTEAIDVLLANVDERNPRRSIGLYLLGALYLGQGQTDKAEVSLRQAVEAGSRFENRILAVLPAIRRDYTLALQILDEDESSTNRSRAGKDTAKAALLADRGDLAGAKSLLLEVARSHVDPERAALARMSEALLDIELRLEDKNAEESLPLEAHLLASTLREKEALGSTELTSAWVLSRAGLMDRETEAALRSKSNGIDRDSMQRMALIDAQQLLLSGRSNEALERLKPLLDGSEFIVVLQLALESATASKNWVEAESYATRLASLRGRAYVEPAMIEVFNPLNVYWASIARLNLAEAESMLGKEDLAKRSLETFKLEVTAWNSVPALRARVNSLSSTLGATTE